jgi:tetratricopeptide (TPR) repeat protein
VAGALFVVLIVVAALLVLRPDDRDRPFSQLAVDPTGSSAVDLSSMSAREMADRLFNRVMSAAEAGDSAEGARFLSKAITSYEMARPLDADGLYHLALLHQTSGDHEAALAAAREVLDNTPDHLLNLSAAAEAAAEIGDAQAAAAYYEHLLEVFDAEVAADRAEYRIHSIMISRLRSEAEAFLQQR